MQASKKIINEYQHPRTILLEQMNDACIALFSEYGVSILPCNLTELDSKLLSNNGSEFVALISMTNPELRLTIALQTQHNVLEESFPSEDKVIDTHDLQDWIGELSNQLSGRLKNKMLVSGCVLELGIPTVIRGDNIYLDLPRRSEISRHPFITESGQVILLSLSTLIDPGFALYQPDSKQVEQSLDEGEMLFF